MRTPLIALAFMLTPLVAPADVLSLPDSAQPVLSALPKKGQTMQTVARAFGEPLEKHPAVGGGSPKHPPITRWDYSGFSVFFENTHVIHAVVPDNPPPIAHADQLHSE